MMQSVDLFAALTLVSAVMFQLTLMTLLKGPRSPNAGQPLVMQSRKNFRLFAMLGSIDTPYRYYVCTLHEAVSSRSDGLAQAQRIKWISAVEAEIASWLAGRDLSK